MDEIFQFFPGVKKQGIANIIKHRYTTMENGYLIELNIEPPLCKFCGNKAQFKNIFHGYKKICNNDECKNKLFLEGSKRSAYSRTIKRTIKVKCCVCEVNEVVIRDTAEKHCIHCCDKEYCKRNIGRSFVREKTIISDFNAHDMLYLNGLSYQLMIDHSGNKKKVRTILHKNLLMNGVENTMSIVYKYEISSILHNFKPDNFILLRDGKCYVNKKMKDKNYFIHGIYGERFFDMTKKYYPELWKKCAICETEYMWNDIFPRKPRSTETCSLECYRKNFKHYITDERIKKQSSSLRKLIEEGRFTPPVHNSMTAKNIELFSKNGCIKFRSSWELMFFVMNYRKSLEYEKLRVKYVHEGKWHNYIVDFIDREEKKVYEIKPSCHINTIINILKRDAVEKWCKDNDYQYLSINEDFLKDINGENFLQSLEKNSFKISDDRMKKLNKYYLRYKQHE